MSSWESATEVQTFVAGEGGLELIGERRVVGCGQHLQVAAAQAGEPVRCTRRAELAVHVVGLHVDHGDLEAESRQTPAGIVEIGDEEAHVVEEDFIAGRHLPVDPSG